jgi:hypothetical protein
MSSEREFSLYPLTLSTLQTLATQFAFLFSVYTAHCRCSLPILSCYNAQTWSLTAHTAQHLLYFYLYVPCTVLRIAFHNEFILFVLSINRPPVLVSRHYLPPFLHCVMGKKASRISKPSAGGRQTCPSFRKMFADKSSLKKHSRNASRSCIARQPQQVSVAPSAETLAFAADLPDQESVCTDTGFIYDSYFQEEYSFVLDRH